MKRLILCCSLLLVLSLTTQAQVRFGIQGDVTNVNIPGAVENIYGLGYGGGVHLDFNAGPLGLRISGDYVFLSPDKDKYRALLAQFLGSAAAGFSIEGGRIDVISGNVNLKFDFLPLPVIHVYATGGGGLVNMGVTEAKITFNGAPITTFPKMESQTKPSVNAGAGVDISLGGLTLFGEVKVVWIMTEGETSTQVPLATVGLTF
jgi:hypothetical protein